MTVTARVLVILATLGSASMAQAGETADPIRASSNGSVPAEAAVQRAAPQIADRQDALKSQERTQALIHADPVAKRMKMADLAVPAPQARSCAGLDCAGAAGLHTSLHRTTTRHLPWSSSAA